MPDKFSTMSAFLYSPKIGRSTYVCTRLMIYAKENERVVYFGLKSEKFYIQNFFREIKFHEFFLPS